MAVLEVAKLGNPVLRKIASPVDLNSLLETEDNSIQSFIDDLIDTMRVEDGVGLAAPQVNRSLRIVALECAHNQRYPDRPDFELLVLVNPEITHYSDEKELGWEGCLSLPDFRGLVPRSRKVIVEAFDRHGEKLSIEAEGFQAVVLQHEIDHLNGMVYLDRMPDMSKLSYQAEFEKYWVREPVSSEN